MKLLFLTLCFFCFAACGFAQSSIKVELYHGLNEGDLKEDDVPKEHPLRKTLDPLIGYDHYKKIGETVCTFNVNYEQWLLPSKVFFLRVNRVDKQKARLELFQEKKSVIQSEFLIRRKNPLLITGPLYGNGKLVLIITNP